TDSVSGLTESYLSKNVLGTNGSTLSVNGGYTVNDGNGGLNYAVVLNTALGTITPATLTLSASTNTKVYDGTTSASGTVGVSGLIGTDSISGLTESYVSKNVLGTNGSAINVNSGFTLNDGNGGLNYTLVLNAALGTITPATLTLSATSNTKIYDGNTSAAAAVGVSGLQSGDTITGLLESYASKNVLGTNGSTLNVDAGYTIHDGNGGANYNVVTNSTTGTINPAALTIAVVDAAKPLGAPLPPLDATTSGFAPGDSLASLSGSLQFLTSATQASPVGVYLVTPAGVSSPNYTISFVGGTLTVLPSYPQILAARVLAETRNNTHDTSGGFVEELAKKRHRTTQVVIKNGGLNLPSDMDNEDGL
ncbi:MAG TPA: YDG domain-containing protein, partial [Moraxellaceae bacterium]|nr:YDG domain-containing protein [Moraxellaceae bacterium]